MTDHGNRSDLAARLRTGEGLVGLILKMPAPALVELAGHLGYDLVVLDTEHGPDETAMLEDHLRAGTAADIPVVVRVAANDHTRIQHALDGGAVGVIVPHVDTADQAAAAVRAAHYPPHGARGLALSTRAGRYGTAQTSTHLRDAERQTLVIAQVEDAAALPHIADIADTPHLDAVWVGPSDLSLSLGYPGQPTHPEVAAAIDHIATHVHASDTRLCVIARDEHDGRQWRRRGAAVVLFSAIDHIAIRLGALNAETMPPDLRRPVTPVATPPAQAAAETS